MLCQQLERYVDRPIIDMTDLKRNLRPHFKIDAGRLPGHADSDRRFNSGVVLPPQVVQYMEGSSISSLFRCGTAGGPEAGSPHKAPLDLIVVDQAQKTPTDN